MSLRARTVGDDLSYETIGQPDLIGAVRLHRGSPPEPVRASTLPQVMFLGKARLVRNKVWGGQGLVALREDQVLRARDKVRLGPKARGPGPLGYSLVDGTHSGEPASPLHSAR